MHSHMNVKFFGTCINIKQLHWVISILIKQQQQQQQHLYYKAEKAVTATARFSALHIPPY
jgi:hypothetical protein